MDRPTPLSLSMELEPYLLCRTQQQRLQCATWQLADGQKALALFQGLDEARRYAQAAALDDTWKLFRPDRWQLRVVLEHCVADEVWFAVLDPEAASARRIFDLRQVLAAAGRPDR